MFGMLKGQVSLIEDDGIILDVAGVGYLVSVPFSLQQALEVGETITFYVQTIVKEDAINLYGFRDSTQKKVFNLLISVQGVGAKIALLILSKLSFEDLQRVIMFEDINTLKEIQGIGLKVAQRVVNELKDKITKISTLNIEATGNSVGKSLNNKELQDAILALQGLGYSSFEVNKALAGVKQSLKSNASSEIIIKEVLQFFAKGM